MNRILSAGLGALALALVLTLILEKQMLGPGPKAPIALLRQPTGGAIGGATGGDAAARADFSPQWVSTILDRPLFSPTRRPPRGAAASASAGGGLPRLSGVMVSGSQTRAIFAGAAGTKTVIAGEGARIGAYVVQSIGAGQVTLVGPDGPLVVRPAFDAAARSATLPTPAAPETAVSAAELGRRALLERIQTGPPPVERQRQ